MNPDPVILKHSIDPGLFTFLLVVGGIWLILLILGIIRIIIVFWVYKDAQRFGMDWRLWVIIIILFGLQGLIVYLIVREDHKKWVYGYGPGYQPPYQYQYYSPPPPPPGGYNYYYNEDYRNRGW